MLRPLCRQSVVGVDFSRPMMAEARHRLEDAPGDAELRFVQANVLTMPFAPRFDVAVCFGALGHILPRDQARFVSQVASALRPGGRFVILTADMPPLYAPRYWLSRGFNATMHLRNLLVRPPFNMFYLTFLVPEATELLEAAGFQLEIVEQLFPPPFQEACVIVATNR